MVLLEVVQICLNSRGVILITFKSNVSIENFIRSDEIQASKNGIRAVCINPTGKRGVIVNLRGLHPNTKDDVIINSLSKLEMSFQTK